jgi:membrane protein DedA with SNARE-associated domain
MNLEQLGLFGVFLAGAIPWFEAIAVVPAGILFGLDPVLTVISAAAGNIITIAVFAYGGGSIRNWIIRRRVAKGKNAESPKLIKAQQAFDKYGIYGMSGLSRLRGLWSLWGFPSELFNDSVHTIERANN